MVGLSVDKSQALYILLPMKDNQIKFSALSSGLRLCCTHMFWGLHVEHVV